MDFYYNLYPNIFIFYSPVHVLFRIGLYISKLNVFNWFKLILVYNLLSVLKFLRCPMGFICSPLKNIPSYLKKIIHMYNLAFSFN